MIGASRLSVRSHSRPAASRSHGSGDPAPWAEGAASETARADFIASLEAAQEEGRRNGFHEIDDVMAELDEIIAEEERAQA